MRALLRGLLDDRPDWFTNDAANDCEHVAQRVDSVVADLVAFQDRAHALQDEFASRQTEKTNQRLTLLSVFSAVFLLPTLITGIFGMNFKQMPWLDWQHGFWTTIGLMALLAFSLLLFFRAKRYIERSDRPRRALLDD